MPSPFLSNQTVSEGGKQERRDVKVSLRETLPCFKETYCSEGEKETEEN